MSCAARWRALGAWWVETETDAQLMDLLVLAPLLALVAAALPLPRVVRYTLACCSGGLLLHNALLLAGPRQSYAKEMSCVG